MKIKQILRALIKSGKYVWGFYLIVCFITWNFPYGVYTDFTTHELNYDLAFGIIRCFGVANILSAIFMLNNDL